MIIDVVETVLTDGWTVFDKAPGALVLFDAELQIVRANAAFSTLVGRESAELVGFSTFAFLPEPERLAAEEQLLARRTDDPFVVDQRFVQPNGREGWMRVHVSTVEDGDDRLHLALIEDTTDHRRTTTRLERLAERDHLTGLLNRRRIEEELEKALAAARRHGRRAALVLIDLDHFKAVNDREGHEEGDRVLSFVAAILATRVREEDAVGRLGGDEFALILADATIEAAQAVAAELVALVADAGYTRERGVTMSAGVAALTPELRSAQSALHAADLAMYTAKAAGRDRVVVHGEDAGADPPRGPVEPRLGATVQRATGPAHVRELLGGLQAVADEPSLSHALEAVRDLLGMEVSYVTQHTESEQVFLATDGEIETFGVGVGTRLPLDQTYCHHILRGDLPGAMPDVRAIAAAAAMPVTEAAGVGAYASVPVRLSDGSLYGTLCAASHEAVPRLADRDLQFLAVLARMVAGEIERDAALRTQLALRVQAAGAEALLSAIYARDRYTGTHSRQVVDLATAVAVELGLTETERAEVAQVALLHDIGKLAVPDAVLSKPGPLTRDEIVLMRRHPEDGERIVASIAELAHLAPAIRAEHERWDGSGYPDRLKGEQIPIASRVVFVCDAWDAMTSDRPYRSRLPREEALAELAAGAGSQFCATCVQALFTVLSRS